jgi:hypothetical protein
MRSAFNLGAISAGSTARAPATDRPACWTRAPGHAGCSGACGAIRRCTCRPRGAGPGRCACCPTGRGGRRRTRRPCEGAVAQRLGAERPHHLRVAVVAALADVDVAPGQLQRGVGLEPSTGCVVERWKNSGTISTSRRSPPSAGSARSSGSCWSRSSRDRQGHVLPWCGVLRARFRRGPATAGIGVARPCRCDRHHHVPGHDQHAGQVQQAAAQADHVERDRWPSRSRRSCRPACRRG